MHIVRKKRKNIPVPMNAMCDIAFLLFIFIMVISVLNKKVPDDFEYAKGEFGSGFSSGIEFFITENGDVLLNGKKLDESETERAVDAAKSTGAEIIVSAHRDAEYRHVFKIIEILKNKRCKNILLSVKYRDSEIPENKIF